jgi:hypothetical protein
VHTIGETLIMPWVKNTAMCMPNESNKKTERVSLSNNKVAYYIPNFAAAIAAIEKELVF